MPELFRRIKDWATTITAFRSGDVIAVDGPSGTAKMSKDSLLIATTTSSLSDNIVAPFDYTRTSSNPYNAGDLVLYNGKVYVFNQEHYGVWSNDHARLFSVHYLVLTEADRYKSLLYHRNLINPDDPEVATGYYVNPHNGTLLENASYNATGFIEVIPAMSYKVAGSLRTLAFFDINRKFISGVSYPGTTLTAPPTAKYVRLSLGSLATSVFAEASHFSADNVGYDSTPYIDYDLLNRGDVKGLLGYVEANEVLYSPNLFNPQDQDVALDKVLATPERSGNLADNTSYNTTGYMEITPNVEYVGTYRDYAFYDKNKAHLGGLFAGGTTFTISNPAARYVRLSVAKAAWDSLVVCRKDSYVGTYTPYSQEKRIRPSMMPPSQSEHSLSYSGTIGPNARRFFNVNICKNFSMHASVSGEFNAVSFGLGFVEFYGQWLEIDASHVYVKKGTSGALVSSHEHGIELDEATTLMLTGNGYTGSATFIMHNSKMDRFALNLEWGVNVGKPFLRNETTSVGDITASLKFVAGDMRQPLWIFGDSYLSFNDPARWLNHIKSLGYDDYLLDARGGLGSTEALNDFNGLIAAGGHPQKILWCLGMNDGSDSQDAPSTSWLQAVQTLLSTAAVLNAEVILMTIPSVPTIDNSKKAEWVRHSGYRYVDAAAAVESEGTTTWKNYETDNAFLSNDGVHPSLYGARAIAEQVLADFPDITFAR